jgi:hypothetical protein
VAADTGGNIYVTDRVDLWTLATGANSHAVLRLPGVHFPSGVAVDTSVACR